MSSERLWACAAETAASGRKTHAAALSTETRHLLRRGADDVIFMIGRLRS
jgi:hypothetical protein